MESNPSPATQISNIVQENATQQHNFETVKVLTYNIFIRPPLIKNNKSDFKSQRLQLFTSDELGKWDIIGFQEMFAAFSDRQNYLIKQAAKKGLLYHVKSRSPSVISKFLIDGGLLILSRYPIVASSEITYSECMQADALAAKGAIHALIQFQPGQFVHVFNTHLQASYNDPRSLTKFQKSQWVRTSQLQELAAFMHTTTKNDSYPIMLLGDFNVNGRKSPTDASDSEEYLNMIQIFGQYFDCEDLLRDTMGYHPPTVGDIHEDGSPREIHLTNVNDQKITKRIDYIWWLRRKDATQAKPEPVVIDNNAVPVDPLAPVSVIPGTCAVAPLFVEGSPFTQLSDHYGVHVHLMYRK